MALRLAGLTRIKNEADVIEAFVRHHLRLFDHLIVADNASCDGSMPILRQLVAEGLPLTVLTDELVPYRQAETMTYLSRTAFAQLDCDRLFLLDADEFVNVPSRTVLEERLATIPAETHGLLRWSTYAPAAGDDPLESNPVRRIRNRQSDEPPTFKLVLSRSFARHPDAVITQGNHDITGGSGTCRTEIVPDLTLAHFPVRSVRQLQNKAVAGWHGYIAFGRAGDAANAWGHQWRTLYERLARPDPWTVEELRAFGATYPHFDREPAPLVCAPLPFSEPLRYAVVEADPLTTAVACAGQLARLYADATRAAEESAGSLEPIRAGLERLAAAALTQTIDDELRNARTEVAMLDARMRDLEAGKLVHLALRLTLFWRRLRGKVRDSA